MESGRGSPQAARRRRAADRRGPPRPAEPGGGGEFFSYRDAVPSGNQPLAQRRPSRRPQCPGRTRAAPARREQDTDRPGDDRRQGTRAAGLGVRAGGPAVPTVRYQDQEGRAGRHRRRAGQVLVSGMPELDAVAVPGRRVATERRREGALNRPGGASANAGLGTQADAAAMASPDLYQSGSPPEGPIPPYPVEADSPTHSGLSRSTERNTDSLADGSPHRCCREPMYLSI